MGRGGLSRTDKEQLREKTTRSIAQLKREIAQRLERIFLEKLEADHVLENDRWMYDRFRIADTHMVLAKEDGRWWIKTERFHCVLESFDNDLMDFWPTLDLKALEERAVSLEAHPYPGTPA